MSLRAGALDVLRTELDAWGEAGRVAPLWWRDDDAARPDAPVMRMLALSARHAAPVFIAVPPALAEPGLAEALLAAPLATPIQHGWAHRDHSDPRAPGASELGADRPLPVVRAEIARGAARMRDLFGNRAAPVMVPPWNRIAAEVAAMLPGLGFAALSGLEGRGPGPEPGLRRLDAHCDPIAWKRGRAFIGAERMAARLAAPLAARRMGAAQGPVGLVSHVWAHDDAAWQALAEVLALVAAHPAARWLGPQEALA